MHVACGLSHVTCVVSYSRQSDRSVHPFTISALKRLYFFNLFDVDAVSGWMFFSSGYFGEVPEVIKLPDQLMIFDVNYC